MSAYYSTLIYGNESFGGYISVDGGRATTVGHDLTYKLDPGPHRFEIYSTSNVERAAGKFQASVYNNTSSSGALWDTLERNQAVKNLGDKWIIEAFVEEGQSIVISIRTSGRKIVATPAYEIVDFTEEQIETLETYYKEEEEKRIAQLNAPRRSKPKIIVGCILTAAFGMPFLSTLMMLATSAESASVIPVAVTGIGALIGIFLFISGMKKKVRK
ncbi:MAG: hypothetical protein J6A85_02245 [Clostridia bacterium]|nr:hypothetical protein [Clostridia bacterium]